MNAPTVAVAGVSGDLGGRIARALLARGASVRALVRPATATAEKKRLESYGATLAEVDPSDGLALATRLEGCECVVSALNGLRSVILDRQTALLDAAVRAGVARFISSDFALDFTKTRPGLNRNLDLRREFMARADRAALRVTSILNGGFMDMLGDEVPIIQPRLRRVFYWRSADQPLDWTTKDDVANYTAAAALDASAPRILRVAGDSISARQLAALLSELAERSYRATSAGSLRTLGLMIGVTRVLVPGRDEPFPPWQGMQYMRDMFSGAGKLAPLDNERYPGMTFTSVRAHLSGKRAW
ncbi:MAG: NmrA family NAD(P)-binding protein [Polyangiaceae bacterium]